MPGRTLVIAVFMTGLSLALPAPGQERAQATPPPARAIPGITTADPFPNACVDCHLNYPEMNMDTRLSTLLRQWQEQVNPKLLAQAQASAPENLSLLGRHPDVSAFMAEIPSGCLNCHADDSEMAPPFGRLMHLIHLTGGEENHFLTVFQGECALCHKLDQATGSWVIPSAPER